MTLSNLLNLLILQTMVIQDKTEKNQAKKLI